LIVDNYGTSRLALLRNPPRGVFLRLVADDVANGIIARQIIELARAGERNPDLLCKGALKKLRRALSGD
jgi:hypothetical protein